MSIRLTLDDLLDAPKVTKYLDEVGIRLVEMCESRESERLHKLMYDRLKARGVKDPKAFFTAAIKAAAEAKERSLEVSEKPISPMVIAQSLIFSVIRQTRSEVLELT